MGYEGGGGILYTYRCTVTTRMDIVLFATFSLIINETLKWLLSMPIVMQESFWW